MAQPVRHGGTQTHRLLRSSRREDVRRSLRSLFTGDSIAGSRSTPNRTKTPQAISLSQDFILTESTLPRLLRASTAPAILPSSTSATSPHTPFSAYTPIISRPITPNSLHELRRTMSLPQPVAPRSARPFVGVDPEEQYLAELVASGRRRRSKRTGRGKSRRTCRVAWSDKDIRSKIIACCLSAILLMIVLTTYLALALSNRQESQEFHVLLILIILVTTIFFCHSLISFCLLAVRRPAEQRRPRIPRSEPGGFADPPHPIRVALARDEEAAGIESEATKYPPPAYGLWRESVRVDPNRLFWQRNEEAGSQTHQDLLDQRNGLGLGIQRPPSYVSEDGISYVIEAAPRSIAPIYDNPLPPHPSELGRT